MDCQKAWAKFDALEIIYKGDINARMRVVSEGD